MISNRRSAGFDSSRVVVQQDPEHGQTFLEDLDIRDGRFTEWLHGQRAARGQSTPLGPGYAPNLMVDRRPIVLLPTSAKETLPRLFEDMFLDVAAKSLRDFYSFDVHFQLPETVKPGALLVTVQSFELRGSHRGLRVTLEDLSANRSIWSHSLLTEIAPGPVAGSFDNSSLVAQLVSAVSESLAMPILESSHDADANALCSLGIRKMFSMRHDALIEADALFAKAYEIEPRGVFAAWRAQLATIRYIERQGGDRDAHCESAREFAALAIEKEPTNSNVLSGVANAKLVLEGNVVLSAELASQSVKANPSNPLGWWSLANAKLYGGDPAAALDAAMRAQQLSEQTPLKFWCDFQLALVNAVLKRTDQAISNFEISQAMAPNFRPPLRYLTALYALAGDIKNTSRVAQMLQDIEPDFSIERLLLDTDYPVSMMRNSDMLKSPTLRELLR
ncbi:MAG: hypothetical protein AAGB15_09710 [Pseudomonadota bacterium]